MQQPAYVYNAVITNVVDGDTIDARVDLGFYASVNIRFRLNGIDTPELTSTDASVRMVAVKAREFVKQFNGQSITLHSYKTDKYGRWLADIFVQGSTKSLNQTLLEENLAVPYFGGSKV